MRERFRAYRSSGSRRLRNQLVLDHRWIADTCARRFAQRGEPEDDLRQVASLALVKAVERFDPDSGNAFSSFAVPTVEGELKRHFRDRTWRVKVPRRARDLLAPMKRTIERLHQELGRIPTVAEIAVSLDVEPDRVVEAMDADEMYRPASTTPASDDDVSIPLADPDDQGERAETRMYVLSAVNTLDERTRKILLWRYYEGLTQSEIGERLGIGQVHVSRLIRRAHEQLRSRLGEPSTAR